MGQNQSKDELLYQQVSYGNIEGIKVLRNQGAGLEWIDKEGKTPLIVACMRPDSSHVAKTLIELGANVNAYRPGSHAGTPLHHAAKRGFEQTVRLLLSHGANPLAFNDDCHTPLDVARAKGHTGVVRTIESYICLFSGWLREVRGPGFLEALAPKLVSRKVWAVVIPCGSRNPHRPPKFALVIYPGPQVAQPSTVIQLWKAKIEGVNFGHSDPAVVILDKATRTRVKFLAENEGDKHQIQWFYNACRGMHQVIAPTLATPAPLEDVELAMAISASIQSAMEERPPPTSDTSSSTETSNTSGWENSADPASHNGWGPSERPALPSKVSCSTEFDAANNTYNGWDLPVAGPSASPFQNNPSQQTVQGESSSQSVPLPTPSAPPVPEEIHDDGPIQYPSVDSSPIDLSMPGTEIRPATNELKEEDGACVICLDAPKEAACVPCGHVVGCVSCLMDIKAKGWGCPVCRANINQVIKLYTV